MWQILPSFALLSFPSLLNAGTKALQVILAVTKKLPTTELCICLSTKNLFQIHERNEGRKGNMSAEREK